MFAAELQGSASVLLLDLWEVRLGGYHHARRLAVHEILLRGRRSECGPSGVKGPSVGPPGASGISYNKLVTSQVGLST